MIVPRLTAIGIVVVWTAASASADGPDLNPRYNQGAPAAPGGNAPAQTLGANPYMSVQSGATPKAAPPNSQLAPPNSPFEALPLERDAQLPSPSSQFAVKQVAHEESLCTQCDDGSCEVCRGTVNEGSRLGFTAFSGTDTFRGPPEGSFQSNFGVVNGLNAALPLVEDWGLGWQLGASYGLYDFSGRSSPAVHQSGAQQQVFVTTGFFRRALPGQILNFGLVHDWMVNDNYGQFGLSPTLGQWRGQIEFACSDFNSLGIWATIHDKTYIGDRVDNHNKLRGINQINFFWHHKFAQGADTWFYAGVPNSKRLVGRGLVGSVLLGASVQAPLTDRLALYANAMYMPPNASPGPNGSTLDAYNVGVGFAWFPGRNARTRSVNGALWLPYMPIGNNSNFLVDASHFN